MVAFLARIGGFKLGAHRGLKTVHEGKYIFDKNFGLKNCIGLNMREGDGGGLNTKTPRGNMGACPNNALVTWAGSTLPVWPSPATTHPRARPLQAWAPVSAGAPPPCPHLVTVARSPIPAAQPLLSAKEPPSAALPSPPGSSSHFESGSQNQLAG